MLNCIIATTLAEIRDKAPEHTGLVHLAQHFFRRQSGRQHRKKQPIGFRVRAQLAVDELQGMADQPGQPGVQIVVVFVGKFEHPQNIGRVIFKNTVRRDVSVGCFSTTKPGAPLIGLTEFETRPLRSLRIIPGPGLCPLEL